MKKLSRLWIFICLNSNLNSKKLSFVKLVKIKLENSNLNSDFLKEVELELELEQNSIEFAALLYTLTQPIQARRIPECRALAVGYIACPKYLHFVFFQTSFVALYLLHR